MEAKKPRDEIKERWKRKIDINANETIHQDKINNSNEFKEGGRVNPGGINKPILFKETKSTKTPTDKFNPDSPFT